MKKNPVLVKRTLVIGIIILLFVAVFFPVSGSMNIEKVFDSVLIDSGPNLDCDGAIVIKRTDPGSTVTGSFIVENIGDSGSQLDWEVSEFPDFGSDWIINPSSGKDLTPEDGQITIEVEFIAPSPEIPTYYGGVIKVVAVDNPDDIDLVAVNINVGRNRVKNELYKTEREPLIYLFYGWCENVTTKGIVFNEPIEAYPGKYDFYLHGIFFQAQPENSVETSNFIGYIREIHTQGIVFYRVRGIAFGNIEWS